MPQVGTVAEMRRYPVKSMLGEVVQEIDVGEGGLGGDRIFGLFDPETGRVVSVKRPKHWARLFEFSASTTPDGVIVTFPDGRRAPITDPQLPGMLSEFFGRRVEIVAVPIPQRAIFDETWMSDLNDNAPPPGDQEPLGEERIIAGGGSFGSKGGLFNYGAVHLLTTGAVRALSEARPGSRFDAYRFRPNMVVDTPETGFLETDWQDRMLRVGEVVFQTEFTVPRCVMTTLTQDDLPADRDVLRTITRLNRVELIGHLYPCLGIYAKVVTPGRVRVGDVVSVQ